MGAVGGDGDKGAAVDVVLSALSGLLTELLNRSSVYGLAFLLCPALMDGWMDGRNHLYGGQSHHISEIHLEFSFSVTIELQ